MDDFELVAGWRVNGSIDKEPPFDAILNLQAQVEIFRARLIQGWVPADVIGRCILAHAQRNHVKRLNYAAQTIARAYRVHRKCIVDAALRIIGTFLVEVSRTRLQRLIRRLRDSEKRAAALQKHISELQVIIRTFTSSTPFNIKNVHSGRFLNILNGSVDFGTPVQMWDNPDWSHSQWKISLLVESSRASGRCVFSIKNVHSGRCLAVQGLEQESKALVTFHDVGSNTRSLWELICCEEAGRHNLRNVWSGRYLNVAGGSKANGANVQQYGNSSSTHSQSPHSQWEISAAAPIFTSALPAALRLL